MSKYGRPSKRGRLILVSRATGHQGEQMGEEYTVMYRWFNDYGYEAGIAALKEEHPGLVSLEQYLRANGW